MGGGFFYFCRTLLTLIKLCMKRLFLLVATLCLAGSLSGQNLQAGKAIPVRLTNQILSNAKVNVDPMAIVERDVKDAKTGSILIKRGTPVRLDAQIQKAKGVGKGGFINLICLSTTAVDGQTIALQGGMNVVGDNNKGTALGVGLGVGLFCWPAMFCLCIKGEKVEIPANTLIHNVVVNDDYNIVID